MNKKIIISALAALISHGAAASSAATHRTPQFSNDRVTAWETVIYPSQHQVLSMHRHEHDRVVVAFNDGILKITNDKDQTHYLSLKKDKAVYLTKDVPNELHSDENMSNHPIKVLVIELNK